MASAASQMKQAAGRTGCTVAEWKAKRENGFNWCMDCRDWLPVDYFNRDASRYSGLQQYCRQCHKIRWIVTHYKVTRREAILLAETKCCQICGREGVCGRCPSGAVRLEIDHDHQTGEVRGVLCSRCNNGIGCFLDSDDLLSRAIGYLLKRRKEALHG
jgi:hypothetical protein